MKKWRVAIRKVSTQSGHDPKEYTLLSFGGAGGQHSCALASMLGMKNILIPYDAGLLSAYGIGCAKAEKFAERLLLTSLEEGIRDLRFVIRDLATDGVVEKKLAFLRFKGQENTIEIDLNETGLSYESILSSFKTKYLKIFGHWS